MPATTARAALMDRLVDKAGGVRSEATIQSDVRILLLDPDLGLDGDDLEVHLEAPAGHGRRIDVEVGSTVIEVKKALRSPAVIDAARTQLTGYVTERAASTGQRYVGILTDGRLWIAYHEIAGELHEAARHTATAGAAGAEPLLRWLEGVLATKTAVRPTPNEIADRLGATSSSHALDFSTLRALYAEHHALPTVVLKRELWANLLRSALGTQFIDADDLFLEHTLLVNSAEIIAHLVVGLPATELAPATLLSGDTFSQLGLHGVVDRDFFDWVLEVPGGEAFITGLAKRLARFDWSQVEHDVLKVLYESVISPETRKALGEYYTPDWLAHRVVTELITDPLEQRVLDPSCGSGTFVFYAVRHFLNAADESGMSLPKAMRLVSSRVMGIDLHPVAVALARVTYLLALGRDRLNGPRGDLSVPIYLGDSLGWDQREDLMSVDHLVIPTDVGDQLASADLRFPEHLLADSARFDAIVESLVDESGRAAHKPTSSLSQGAIRLLAIEAADLPTLNENFVRLKQLHEDDRDHIWSYYVRNVARPAWLAREENRVDVLIGNPPWLSYRHMEEAMQRRFKSLSQDRDLWHNETTATHQDLAGLFVARAVERYLKPGGHLGFVVPNSVIDRDYWAGFRNGRFDGAAVSFTTPWDLRRIRPHLFPRGSAVIFGTRTAKPARMPRQALLWTGRAPHRHASVQTAAALTQAVGDLALGAVDDENRSPYSTRFAQGANLVPRVFFRVEEVAATALGLPAGRRNLRSKRSVSEKTPWKALPDLTGTVESEFVWPTLLGEHVVPYRVTDHDLFVVPVNRQGHLLTGDNPKVDAYPGLATWVRNAEGLWAEHRRSKLTLGQQIDHMRKLTQQMPPPALRVVYAKAGMHVAAALVADPKVVIDHKLYWAAVSTEAEGYYLLGILNSPSLTELVRPLMSYGKDERDIDKHVWKLPIPTYNGDDEDHAAISALARQVAEAVGHRSVDSTNFVAARRDLRAHLAADGVARDLDRRVRYLLGGEDLAPSDLDDAVESAAGLVPLADRASTRWSIPGSRPSKPSEMDLDSIVEIDVDCEFDRDGRVYLWGRTVSTLVDGQVERGSSYKAVGDAHEDFDEVELARRFAEELRADLENHAVAGNVVHWYHYGGTERHQLRRLLGGDADDLLANATDLLGEIVRPHFYAPQGYSLKTLGRLVGATWRTPGATGADTFDLIDRARAGHESAWTRLLEYNEDDTRATMTLRKGIRAWAEGADPAVVHATATPVVGLEPAGSTPPS
ncbi:Eco57I restriction-modification methylase domain-containing protein [Nocardioides litoris]|uniref:Eco57I restriction-modification methylase domain-containing protein n=1 Tax=Nocardioides litoris TaxID=1926648 RepID=UPI0011232821|nr:N-6 DNA methylase [Nocardioides litoris]